MWHQNSVITYLDSFKMDYTNIALVIRLHNLTVGTLLKSCSSPTKFLQSMINPCVFTMTQAHFHLRVASDL